MWLVVRQKCLTVKEIKYERQNKQTHLQESKQRKMKLFLLLFLMDTLPLMECCLSRQMFSWLSSVPEEDFAGCPSTCLSLCVIFIFFSNRSFWSQNAPLPKIIPLSSTLVCHNNHSWLQLYQQFNCQPLAHVACLFFIWGKVKRGQYRRWSNRPIFSWVANVDFHFQKWPLAGWMLINSTQTTVWGPTTSLDPAKDWLSGGVICLSELTLLFVCSDQLCNKLVERSLLFLSNWHPMPREAGSTGPVQLQGPSKICNSAFIATHTTCTTIIWRNQNQNNYNWRTM